ncbi:MAG: hypothetical protein B7Z58_01290 [Acidiphilium sp. 37-64-53]|uniref:cell division protein FtsL n=1 Tax=Acidiphilium TaxID=522 RepID=UPI000BC777E3|nr:MULTISPECIES: hypothetical protein [Acidiphilium]OYW04228.1 MAG: hypothetical protein B7Z58_01290 [Acidiphilium sp. 37-64-53]OZB31159.1 MAG: hypothetical protein B7X49_00825 [Acidiphilium sp. 34-64-41]HQT83482.1 hypothetical protein [Acidiphilium rubrum]
MIRPVTFVTTLMALSSGAWMFVVKHQAEQLDRQIGGVTSQIRASEQRIRVLRAEWALETDPNRLTRLAAMFLPELKPMAPDQLVTWSELADRLPPPGATVPHLPLPPPMPSQLPDATAASGPIASIAPPAVVLPPNAVPVAASAQHQSGTRVSATATTRLAAARPVMSAHQRPIIHRVGLPVVHHALPKAAHPVWSHPIPLGRSVLAPARTVRPMGAQVMTINAQSAPIAPPVPQRPFHAAPRPAAGASTSVFGGYAANLAPPRPVGSTAP